MFKKRLTWLQDRIGLRPALNPLAKVTHENFIAVSKLWFEGLKRLAILTALSTAGQHSMLVEGIYFATLLAFMAPIMSWLDLKEIDFKTRKPTHYRPETDGKVTTPLAPEAPAAWAYSPLLMGLGVTASAMVHLCIQLIVMELTELLANGH